MEQRKRILDQWLSRLEAERELIEGAILEINRRLAVPGEVEEWNLISEPDDEFTATDQTEFDSEESMNGSGPLISYSR